MRATASRLLRSLLLLGAVAATTGATRAPLKVRRGAVASSHVLASQVGVDILRRGGSAVDAAVAVAFVVGVVEPHSAGMGGGGFALWYQAHGRVVRALDFRERAPLAATPTMYLDARGQVVPGASTQGYLAVAVPGTVAGLGELHRAGGRLPWKEVVLPAQRLAEEGVVVGPRLHHVLSQAAPTLRRFPEAAATFLKRGAPYDVGDLLIQRDLADTLRVVAEEGATAFYGGDIARAIAAEMEDQGGLVTLEDLEGYRPAWRQPLAGTYHGHTVVSFPPPSSGGIHLLQVLGFVSREGVAGRDRGSASTLHLLAEAMRRAYADRATWLGDPAYVEVPVRGLLASDYLAGRWATFSPQVAGSSRDTPAGDPWPFDPAGPRSAPATASPPREGSDTAHLCVVDADRNVVSLTFTLNTPMGSATVVPGTGILLNNEMDDFSAAPGHPNAFGLVGGESNAVAPAKVPLSSMAPTIVFRGSGPVAPVPDALDGAVTVEAGTTPRLCLGAPGGSTIITTVLQVVLNVVDHGMDVEEALAAPRVHHQWSPDVLRVERGTLPAEVRRGLFARGHVLQDHAPWGNATVIELMEGGGLAAASDPRGEGVPAGY
jgi:gamma-glutamyltranspeptidase/glutathione hydrolase